MSENRQRRSSTATILTDSHFLVPFIVLIIGVVLLALLH